MSDVLQSRLREHRARLAVRAWEYRQRHHANGVWFRLRRALADAAELFVIDDSDARRLVAAGHPVHPAGSAIEPPKIMLVVSREALADIPSARAIRVGLNAEFLGARSVVLVPFQCAAERPPAPPESHPASSLPPHR